MPSGSFDSGSGSAIKLYIRSSDKRSWNVGATIRDCEGEGGDGPAGCVGEEEGGGEGEGVLTSGVMTEPLTKGWLSPVKW